MSDKPPRNFTLCKLWVRTGISGRPFYSGRIGGGRVLVVPNDNRSSDDDADYLLVIGPADPNPRQSRKEHP